MFATSRASNYAFTRTNLRLVLIMGTCFHLKSLRFPSMEGEKLYGTLSIIYQMRRYAGQNEVRFKVTDKQKKVYIETSRYLYEINKMDKSNIHSFGRWCMDYVCQVYRFAVLESNVMKQQQRRPDQMQQPPPAWYPSNYTTNHTLFQKVSIAIRMFCQLADT